MKVGFLSILTILFITLKLCHVIFWSWWLILLPAYAGVVLLFISLAVVGLVKYKEWCD